jgi:serine/threonine protein kinase
MPDRDGDGPSIHRSERGEQGHSGESLWTEAEELAAGTSVDHFRIVRLLGRGGMGEVYLARDTTLGRKVALKVLRPKQFDSDSGVERFLFEARATARFNHPHIITLYGAGRIGDRPYVALEYLEGETLRDRMRRERLGSFQTMRIGLAIADALREAHRHKILHRDLKPENVMIPADGRVRVLDFGLAKSVPGHQTPGVAGDGSTTAGDGAETSFEAFQSMDGGLRGTPRYLAPEQWSQMPVTPAADIWALGLILYELSSGDHPWPDADVYQLCHQVTSSTSVPPVAETVHPGLRALIERCLSKDPAERPRADSIIESERAPFRGLLPCDESDADLFFGRDAEIDAFLERLRREPVLPIVGPSGAGKSSFVQAGIIPRLLEGERWIVLKLRPGRQPMRSLASRLLQSGGQITVDPGDHDRTRTLSGDPAEATPPHPGPSSPDLETAEQDLTGELLESPARLALRLSEIAEREQARVLLFVDQLEELYSLVRDPAIRHAFMEALCMAADDPMGPTRVVFTLRDDFLGRLAVGEVSRQTLGRVTVLRSPRPEALEEILARSVAAAGYHYDAPELVREMVSAVEGEAAALPLLQVAGQTLWEMRDRDGRQLRRAAYVEMGGVAGALARHADGVLDGLSAAQLKIARQLLVRLVTPEGTRAVVSRAQLVDELGSGIDEVLDTLVQGRLVLIRRARKVHGAAELELVTSP